MSPQKRSKNLADRFPADLWGRTARERALHHSRERKSKRAHRDDDCLICDGTGHRESCDSRQPAWDIADLICASPCDGCCPNGCEPRGLQAAQDNAQKRANALLGRR